MKGLAIILPVLRKIKNLYHWFSAILANTYFGRPSRKLKVVGVTGTDGKTTTVTLIDHILTTAGKKSGFVSTVESQIAGQKIAASLHTTTPDPWQLQKLIRLAVDQGLEYLVLEVSSHGLDQHRLAGINFEVGVLTNVTHEHFDYHKTYQNYLLAKAKLFQRSKTVILNKDDRSFKILKSKIPPHRWAGKNQKSKIIAYSVKKQADFTPDNFQFTTELPGEHNRYNCLAAIAAASALGADKQIMQKAVASFAGVRGRMEAVKAGQPFKIFVDFAHTPNGLRQVLRAARPMVGKGGKLTVVFGSAGRRDVSKRPLMGKWAGKLADVVILTTDDPRDEPVYQINKQIAAGIRSLRYHDTYHDIKGGGYLEIADRDQAIKAAFTIAKKGDVVLLCGKGHERSLTIGRQEIPWDEKQAAVRAWREVSSQSMVS